MSSFFWLNKCLLDIFLHWIWQYISQPHLKLYDRFNGGFKKKYERR